MAHDANGDHDVEVVEVEVRGSAFTIDAAIARLESEGVQVVRTSPSYMATRGAANWSQTEHKLIFKASDREAVGAALRDAGLV